MKSESLETARVLILDLLDKSDIEVFDKTELIINLMQFLNEMKYDDNIKILRKEHSK